MDGSGGTAFRTSLQPQDVEETWGGQEDRENQRREELLSELTSYHKNKRSQLFS